MWKILYFGLFASLSILANGIPTAEESEDTEGDGISGDIQQVRDNIEYSLGAFRATWYQAQQLCGTDQTLARINDTQDYSSVISFVLNNGLENTAFWLGGSRFTGIWTWPDNSRILFTQWNRGEPRVRGGNCLVMGSNYKWFASNCNIRRNFICEKSSS